MSFRQDLIPPGAHAVARLLAVVGCPPAVATRRARARRADRAADRSLRETKSLAGWQATVRRMAGKPGADIGTEEGADIAVYLAGRGAGGGDGAAKPDDETCEVLSLSAFAAVSPLWRGCESAVQNNGFFPEAFVGASWQRKGPLSVRVTACVSCHGAGEPGFLNRIELVEVVARVDLVEALALGPCRDVQAAAEAGPLSVWGARYVVTF